MPRDVNGQYELPAGNPVVSGTIISTNWANDTMADLANALTNSLSRNGNGGMLAPFLNADGSQSAPGISWANEPSMGLWREGAQDMRLGVSGAPTQRWNDQGSQLWRNSQWEEILTQTGGGGDTTINNLVVTGSFTSPGIDDNANATAITIDANENVGIGTDDPRQQLVVSTADNGFELDPNASSGNRLLSYSRASGQYSAMNIKASTLQIDTSTAGTVSAVTVDSAGNVGIGEPSPQFKLDVNGSTTSSITDVAAFTNPINAAGTGHGARLLLHATQNPGRGVALASSSSSNYAADNDMLFYTGASSTLTEHMRITSTGNVGINETDPEEALHVSSGRGGFVLERNGTSYDGKFRLMVGGIEGGGFKIADMTTGSTQNRLTIDPLGNVGIGIDASQTGLQVATTSYTYTGTSYDIYGLFGTTGGGVRLGRDSGSADGVIGTTGTGGLQFVTYNGSAWDSRMTLTNAGNVGIGTDAPAALLAVNGSSAGELEGLILRNENSAASGQSVSLTFETSSGTSGGEGAQAARIEALRTGFGTTGDLLFHTSDAGNSYERMRIDSDGNLKVANGGRIYVMSSTGFSPFIDESANGLDFWTNTAKRMTINGSGNVGIGTDNPSTSLDVVGSTTNGSGVVDTLSLRNTGTSFADGTRIQFTAGTSTSGAAIGARGVALNSADLLFYAGGNTERVRIDTSGNLLVGTTTDPASTNAGGAAFISSSYDRSILRLAHTDSGSRAVAEFYGNSSTAFAGRITCNATTTAYNTSSDERLKDNIVDAPAGNIDSIKVRSFDWKADGEHQEYGFIAQELETVAPYAVTKGETDEDTWGVDYSKLVPMLVKEIQDLKAEVAALKA